MKTNKKYLVLYSSSILPKINKCREKEVDFTKDVIYMYYRDLVK